MTAIAAGPVVVVMTAIAARPVMEPEQLPRRLGRFPHPTIMTRQDPSWVSGLSLSARLAASG
jgi:hypothetical protein